MVEYGLNNVRGAEYCQVADFVREDAKRMSYAAAHHLPGIDREVVQKRFERECAGPPPRVETSCPPPKNKMGVSGESAYALGSSYQVPASQYKRATAAPAASSKSGDILETLRALRDECAKRKGVPAYAVFTNDTLLEMAEVLPTTEAEFLSIKGVGNIKCRDYGSQFMSAIIDNMLTTQYCESCGEQIDVNPSKPVCLDCYRAKRRK